MDISIIKADKVNAQSDISLVIPLKNKPYKIMNVHCPYCKKWFKERINRNFYRLPLPKGKCQRVIKLLDKEKASTIRKCDAYAIFLPAGRQQAFAYFN